MEEKFEVSELLSGRPDREISDKEKDCYDMLDELDSNSAIAIFF